MREFTTKEDLNTEKEVLLLISLRPWFASFLRRKSSYKNTCCVKANIVN